MTEPIQPADLNRTSAERGTGAENSMTSAENSGSENNTYVAPLPAPNSLVAKPANAQTGAYSPNAMHPIKPAKVKRAPRHAPSPYEPAPSPLYNAAYPAAFAYSATPSAPYASQSNPQGIQSNPDLRAPRNSAYPAYSIYSAPLTSGPMAAVPTKAKKINIRPALSYTAPRVPEPVQTTYTRPWELIRRNDWYKGHGYAATLRDTFRNPWWKPVAITFIFVLFYLLVSLALYVVAGLAAFGQLSIYTYQQYMGLSPENFLANPASPTVILLTFGGVAIMLPALWWTIHTLKSQSFGSLSSVYGHLRWSAMFKSTAVSFIFFALLNLASIIVAIASGEKVTPHAPSIVSLLLIITVIPIQCATEEYVFRGLLLQAMGRWLPRITHVLVPIIPALIFTAMHDYDLIGLTTIFSLGIITGYLAMYLGGLEAGIGMHIANNVSIMLFAAFGFADGGDSDSATSPIFASIDIAVQITIAVIIVYLAVKRGWFDAPGRDYAREFYDGMMQSVTSWKQRRSMRKQMKRYYQQQRQQQMYFAYPQQPSAPVPPQPPYR